MEKLTDNTESVRLSCPTLSQPHTLCSINNDIADLGSTGPACPLAKGHFCLSCISEVFEDSLLLLLLLLLLLPRENKPVCSGHSTLSLLPASLLTPNLPCVQ